MTKMPNSITKGVPLVLRGINGSNPVGFLASLGVVATLDRRNQSNAVKLAWQESAGVWNPVVYSECLDVSDLGRKLAAELNCPFTPTKPADELREARQKMFDGKKKDLKDALAALKAKKLRGKERDAEVVLRARVADEQARLWPQRRTDLAIRLADRGRAGVDLVALRPGLSRLRGHACVAARSVTTLRP